MVTGNEVSAITGLGFCWVCVRGNSKPVTTFAEQPVAEVSRLAKMVTGNEVSAQEGLDHSRSVLVRGNSKPVTTFAEPAISTTAW